MMTDKNFNGEILIVDDNPTNLQVLGNILKQNGYHVEFSISGAAALVLLEFRKVDLILLDINMSEMNGFELCEKLRLNQDFDNIPIIFLSAEYGKEAIVNGFKVGAQDFVTKPFDSRELLVRIKTQIDLKQYLEEINELNATLEAKVERRTKQLDIALQKAEESNRLKTIFLQNVAHEVKTPMNGIFGFADLLKNYNYGEKEKQEFIDVILKSAKRLLNTIDDLVEISAIQSNPKEFRYSIFNVNDVFEPFVESYKDIAKEKGIELKFTLVDNHNPRIVKTDRDKLASILKHLLNNAVKFTDSGYVDVKMNITQNTIEIGVVDTGIGISKEKRAKLFQSFDNESYDTNRVNQGLGIGLSIVKANVDALAGKIVVNSEISKGTSVFVSIPYIKPIAEIAVSSEGRPNTGLPQDIRILIVDDVETNLMVLEFMLVGDNRKIIKSCDGESATNVLMNDKNIDIVLMDLKMPGIGGLEAVRRIRTFNKSVPIIAQSAYDFEANRQATIEAGFNDFISKPIIRNKLIEIINENIKMS